MFSYALRLKFSFFFLRFWRVLVTVKYFSPMTNLCIVRVARGTAANTTWAALVLLNRVCSSGGGQGRKVVPHVVHVSGTSPTQIFPPLPWVCHGFCTPGTLKHAQIAAVEWNREAIARVKAGVGVYGMSACPCLVHTFIDGVLLGSCGCSFPAREHRRHTLRNEHTGNRRVAGLMVTDKAKRNPAIFRCYTSILRLLPVQGMLYYCDFAF
jgi:hypothetical protein